MGPAAAVHVQEVVVEALVAGGVGFGALGTLPEEAQRGQGAANRLPSREEAALDADRVGGESHADRGDARRPVAPRLVPHEAVARVGLVEEVGEALSLDLVQHPMAQISRR